MPFLTARLPGRSLASAAGDRIWAR
jgi:hypothetical protein